MYNSDGYYCKSRPWNNCSQRPLVSLSHEDMTVKHKDTSNLIPLQCLTPISQRCILNMVRGGGGFNGVIEKESQRLSE